MLFPGYHKLVHWRVARAERRGDNARAEKIASRATLRRPNDCTVRLVWASFHARQRQLAEAEHIIREAPDACATDYYLGCLLAQTLHRRGDRKGAEQLARELVEREPGEGEAWCILAGVAAKAGKYDEAVELLKKTSSRRVSSAMLSNAASIAIVAGERELAESLASRATTEDPRDPGWHMLMSVLLQPTNGAEAAREWRLAERYRRNVSEDVYRRDVEYYRSLMAKLGTRPNAPATTELPRPELP